MDRLFRLTFLAALVLVVAGCATLGGGRPVADTEGRFTFSAGKELTPKAEEPGLYSYRLEKEGIDVHVVAQAARFEDEGVEAALRRTGVDPATLVTRGNTAMGDWQAIRWGSTVGGPDVAMAYQARGGSVYALVVTGDPEAMPEVPGPAMRLLGSIRFTTAAGSLSVPRTRQELEMYIDHAAAARAGSITVAVVRGGEVVYRYASGTSEPDTAASPEVAYHWGSMTKPVTAVAVMKLVEEKRVKLDAPVADYIAGFPREHDITVRHLLTHSSGLPDAEFRHLIAVEGLELPSLDTVLARYLEGVTTLDFAPGTESAYNNWNYLALGVLVERVAGVSFESYVTRTILAPLGMTRTAFRHGDLPTGTPLASPTLPADEAPGRLTGIAAARPELDTAKLVRARTDDSVYFTDFDILAPWGGLVGPADDAALFLSLGSKLLSAKTIDSMYKAQRSTTGRPLGWGLGWSMQAAGQGAVEHAGGGIGIACLMRLYPREGLGVVVMSNGGYSVGRILTAAADIFRTEGR